VRVASKATASAEPAAPKHASAAKPTEKALHEKHWDYQGEGGPQAWGGLRPEFGLCSTGKRQSPIDIRDGITVDLESVQFDYRASRFGVIDNGHTVQVNVAAGNVNAARWAALGAGAVSLSSAVGRACQRAPVRHGGAPRAQGRRRQARGGGGAARARQRAAGGGRRSGTICRWKKARRRRRKHRSTSTICCRRIAATTPTWARSPRPPCSEGVQWIVMQQPVPLSQQQLDIFARLYPMNARPLQQASGALIKQSQ